MTDPHKPTFKESQNIAIELHLYAAHFSMRIGQFIECCTPHDRDLFYIEDVELLNYARDYFNTHGGE